MIVNILSIFAILCIASVVGKLAAKIKMPAILGCFVIGIGIGFVASSIIQRVKSEKKNFALLLFFLCLSVIIGIVTDIFLFHSFKLNYILIGMAFSATVVNLIPEAKSEEILKHYNGILSLSLMVVIVNLGMPLDYRLIAGAGLFTAIYIISRAIGKIGNAYIGGKLTKAPPTVTKYLGFTLLPHSGVSLVFTGIAATTLNAIDPSLATIIQGTIVVAAIINEIIAFIVAKYAFVWAGEIKQ